MPIFAASKSKCGAETAGITSSLFCTNHFRRNQGLTTPCRVYGNVPGGLAFRAMTARSVVYLCQNLNVMETKNYLFHENATEQQYFCQLQVSNKFRKSMNAYEQELCDWMVQQLVHRTVSREVLEGVLDRLQFRVSEINSHLTGAGPSLTFIYQPLRPEESGFIRIERTGGRHQSVLLPIIDCRGSVNIH